jgi:hypothetical protein
MIDVGLFIGHETSMPSRQALDTKNASLPVTPARKPLRRLGLKV